MSQLWNVYEIFMIWPSWHHISKYIFCTRGYFYRQSTHSLLKYSLISGCPIDLTFGFLFLGIFARVFRFWCLFDFWVITYNIIILIAMESFLFHVRQPLIHSRDETDSINVFNLSLCCNLCQMFLKALWRTTMPFLLLQGDFVLWIYN